MEISGDIAGGIGVLTIRPATSEDLGAIREIYNDAVLKTVASFDIEPRTPEEQEIWFATHGSKYPIVVAEQDDLVVGWASLSKWSDRGAYSDTAEISFYVKEEHQRKGIGRKLLEKILQEGQNAGLHAVIAQIAEGNEVSIRLAKFMGFDHVGILKEVGQKFGRLLDVYVMQKTYSIAETSHDTP